VAPKRRVLSEIHGHRNVFVIATAVRTSDPHGERLYRKARR
jgi:hypothetical protein